MNTKMDGAWWPFAAGALIIIGTILGMILQYQYRNKVKDKQEENIRLTNENQVLVKDLNELAQTQKKITGQIDATTKVNQGTTERIEKLSLKIDTIVSKNTKLGVANRKLAAENVKLSRVVEQYQTGGSSYPLYLVDPSLIRLADVAVDHPKIDTVRVSLSVVGEFPVIIKSSRLHEDNDLVALKELMAGMKGMTPQELEKKLLEMGLLRPGGVMSYVEFEPGLYEGDQVTFLKRVRINNVANKDSVHLTFLSEARNGKFRQKTKLVRPENSLQWLHARSTIHKENANGESILIHSINNEEE